MSVDYFEEFCNMLTPEKIKLLNLIFKERHVEIRNKKETKIKDRDKIREKENRISKTIFLNECREVFKKDKDSAKDSKELKGNRTDRSDFENIFTLLFNRFKVIKDEKSEYETARNKVKIQTPTLKYEKKTDKNLSSIDTKTRSIKYDSVHFNESKVLDYKENSRENRSLIKQPSDKESKTVHYASYNERIVSDLKDNNDKISVKGVDEKNDKKKEEVGFFLTVHKDSKKPDNNLNVSKAQESQDGRLKDRLDPRINKSDLFSNEEIKQREHKNSDGRVPSQNTENNSAERKSKNHLNETRKTDHLDKKSELGKMAENKKSERNKERILNKDITRGITVYDEDEEQIEAYEVIIALCIYARVNFKNKIKLLFEITDVDDDGYINEDEIKKLIFTVHLNFSEEISPIDCKSFTLSQSLACIKAQQILDMIINYPGNLKQTIVKEKYVQWENFYKSIEKIPNYTYKVIPTFLNIRTSIETQRKEIDFKNLDIKNINEMLNLTKEICGNIKSSVNFMNKVTNKGEFNNIVYKGKKQEESQFNKIIEFENRLNRLIYEASLKNNLSETLEFTPNHHISLEETMAIIKNNNGRSNDDLQDGEAAIINRVHEVNGIHDKLVQMFSKSSNIKIDHFYIDIN